MGFSLSNAIGGAGTGAGIGFMAGGPVGAGIGALVGGGAGGLFPEGEMVSQSQVPLETPEQALARKFLLNSWARTGKFGGITAGEEIPIGTAGYDLTDLERSGLTGLERLLASGERPELSQASSALERLLANDPASMEAMFSPYEARIRRATQESSNEALRRAGITGNLYGTQTIRELGDVEARGQEVLAQKLAELTNQQLDRSLQAVPQAINVAAAREGVDMGRIGAASRYGSLERLLAGARDEAEREEKLRQRGEVMSRISALGTVANKDAQFGIPSVSTYQPSTFERLLQMVAGVGGQVAPALIAQGKVG